MRDRDRQRDKERDREKQKNTRQAPKLKKWRKSMAT